MKKFIIILALTAFAVSAVAGPLDRDSQELGVSGLVDFDSAFDTQINLTLKYGYFWIDDLEFGALLDFEDNDLLMSWGLGGFAEYNFRLDYPVTPYIGAALKYQASEIDFGGGVEEDEDAVVADFNIGAKYFLAENVALDTAFVFSIASSDVFAESDGIADTDWKWVLGLRFFFF